MGKRRRFFVLGAAAALAGFGIAVGCSDSETTVSGGGADATTSDAPNDSARSDASRDTGGPTDAGGGTKRDANGPGEAGAECSFNHNCQLALRCECDGLCFCQPGLRGVGKSGLDGCDSGNQCESALCLEGPGGQELCSDECASATDCPMNLPLCESVIGVGQICVRQP